MTPDNPEEKDAPTVISPGIARSVAAGNSPAGGPRASPDIPDHQLIRCIGSGSYGEVWLARNVMGNYRAVKIVYRKTFENDRPFEREFNGIQKFEPISRSDDSQVDILHVGRNQDYFYYVMELADDQTRGQQIDPASYAAKTLWTEMNQRGRLPFAECLEIGLALTAALEHLHKNGLVHRDVKPSNVIFVNGVPKLADIGLVTDSAATMSYVGTEGFLPPEGPGTAQADIYSLGKVLYEISTGKDRKAFPEPPTLLGEFADREEFLEFSEVTKRACANNPQDRYPSIAAMRADLMLLKVGKSVRQSHRLAAVAKVGIVAAVIIVLTSAVGLVLLNTGLGDRLVKKSYDYPFAIRPIIHPTEVAMVYLDQASRQHLGQSYREPWPRSYYTKLLNRLTADKAKAVVFDVMFSDPRDPAMDQQFADAILANGSVVLATDWNMENDEAGRVIKKGFIVPYKLFAKSAAVLASSTTFPDMDNRIRAYLPQDANERSKSLEYGSEAWAVASLIGTPATKDKTWGHKPIWLNYYGPTSVLPGVSLYQAIADNDPNVPQGFFSNKVVFIGVRVQNGRNEFQIPFSNLTADNLMPGVAIHATACLNLIRGDWLRRFSHLTESVIIIVLGILLGGGLVLCRPIPAIFIALAAAIMIAVMNYCMFVFLHYWFPWLIVVVGQIPIALISAVEVGSRSRRNELS
jgi:serine/threonine protein kinase